MKSASEGYVVASHEGPAWDMESGRPATFKLLSNDTGGKVAVFEEVVPPSAGTPLHIHHTSDEVLYVLSGEFTVRLGERSHRVSTGAWVFIPLGSVHGWRNSGSRDGRMFFVFTPGVGAEAFEEMRLEGKHLPEIDPATRDAIFARHGYEFITWDWD
jgi:quercetin dioxygenase-like cupin family protein